MTHPDFAYQFSTCSSCPCFVKKHVFLLWWSLSSMWDVLMRENIFNAQ